MRCVYIKWISSRRTDLSHPLPFTFWRFTAVVSEEMGLFVISLHLGSRELMLVRYGQMPVCKTSLHVFHPSYIRVWQWLPSLWAECALLFDLIISCCRNSLWSLERQTRTLWRGVYVTLWLVFVFLLPCSIFGIRPWVVFKGFEATWAIFHILWWIQCCQWWMPRLDTKKKSHDSNMFWSRDPKGNLATCEIAPNSERNSLTVWNIIWQNKHFIQDVFGKTIYSNFSYLSDSRPTFVPGNDCIKPKGGKNPRSTTEFNIEQLQLSEDMATVNSTCKVQCYCVISFDFFHAKLCLRN